MCPARGNSRAGRCRSLRGGTTGAGAGHPKNSVGWSRVSVCVLRVIAFGERAPPTPDRTSTRSGFESFTGRAPLSLLSNQTTAAQAYYQQALDVENEMQASRIRVRAERRLGEILRKMAESGERAKGGKPSRGASVTKLRDMGIPYDRASRARQLFIHT